jgi:hypothetical protein
MSQMSKHEIEDQYQLLLKENLALGARLDRAEYSLAMYRQYVETLEQLRDSLRAQLLATVAGTLAGAPRLRGGR